MTHPPRPKLLFGIFTVADIIAMMLVFGVIWSNLQQVRAQFMIPQSLLIIIGFYFGHEIESRRKNGD